MTLIEILTAAAIGCGAVAVILSQGGPTVFMAQVFLISCAQHTIIMFTMFVCLQATSVDAHH